MILTTKELIKEFKKKNNIQLPEDEIRKVVETPFLALKDAISSDKLESFRIKYLGKFIVYPKRVKFLKKNLEERKEAGKIIENKEYLRLTKMFDEYLEKHKIN